MSDVPQSSAPAPGPADPSPLSADASISQAAAIAHWSNIPATVDGMLGGLPQVSRTDLQSSSNFLAKLRLRRNGADTTLSSALLARAVDCGAGIGRITKGMLVHHAATVDIVEPVAKFCGAISSTMLTEPADADTDADADAAQVQGTLGDIYNVGLESWTPPPGTHYDVVWNQWCLGQLTDAQLHAYLGRCVTALAPGGWIVVKENTSTNADGADDFDDVDNSVTRSHSRFLEIFEQAGLKVVATERQKGFPKELYPVRSYALQP